MFQLNIKFMFKFNNASAENVVEVFYLYLAMSILLIVHVLTILHASCTYRETLICVMKYKISPF